jgi:hypothetical protein
LKQTTEGLAGPGKGETRTEIGARKGSDDEGLPSLNEASSLEENGPARPARAAAGGRRLDVGGVVRTDVVSVSYARPNSKSANKIGSWKGKY